MYSGSRPRRKPRSAELETGEPPPRRARLGNDVADEVVAAGRDHRVPHRRVLAQDGLDLAELDAEAAQLHLVVDAAEELEVAAGQPADKIAGAIEPVFDRAATPALPEARRAG